MWTAQRRPRIFVTQPVSETALKRLRAAAKVKVFPDTSRIIPKRTLVAAVRQADILFCLLHDKIDRAIVTVKGSGARKLAVFSDPDCPYCKQLERELDGISDVTIYTFLYPIVSLHPDAARKARLVWCASDRARAWSELMLRGREPENAASCPSPLADNLVLGGKLSIDGTPGIVFPSGRLVPGVIARDLIERYLSERTPSG